MSANRRILTAILVWWAATAGFVQAQDWAAAFGSDSDALAAFLGAFEVGGAGVEAMQQVLAAAYAGAAELSGVPIDDDEGGTICAFLAGAGGNPRLDGGGNLLATFDQSWVPFQLPSPTGWPAERGRRLVILDDFDLTALGTSVRAVIDAYGGVAVDPGSDDRRGLWYALYGYRIALEPTAQRADVPVPHGHLVAFHALAHLGPDARIELVRLERDVWSGLGRLVLDVRSEASDETLEVRLVHVEFDDLESIRVAVNAYANRRDDVVVASWGLVDCAIASRYRAAVPAADETITAYFREALQRSAQGGSTALQDLCAALAPVLSSVPGVAPDCEDPDFVADLATLAWVADLGLRSSAGFDLAPDGRGAQFFASAGNQGLAIPMPPAAWPGVIGVESCSAGALGQRSTFSNVGGSDQQVVARALGAWFVPTFSEPYGYWGTSFAAPAAAVAALSTPRTQPRGFLVPPCE